MAIPTYLVAIPTYLVAIPTYLVAIRRNISNICEVLILKHDATGSPWSIRASITEKYSSA